MKVRPFEELPEARIIEPEVFEDERGFFLEIWRHERYAAAGIDLPFVQDNHSRSAPGVLRGLHFQHPEPQAKLVHVIRGEILDVIVDVRIGSPRFGRWASVRLSAGDPRQVFVPEGFAHGFAALGDGADVLYKCSAPYRPEHERVLAWNDPALGIEWSLDDPVLSPRDADGRRLAELRDEGSLPTWRE